MAEADTAYAFLSYSRRDQAFAARLAQDLRRRGIRLWFDQLDIVPGENWDDAIQRALHGAKALLLVVSESSVASENVLNELTVALDSRKWVVPIMIANVQVPLRIVRMQRVDFMSNYAAAVEHLVAYMLGRGSRTFALEAVATAPPQPVGRGDSLQPLQGLPNPPGRRASWVGPALVALGAIFMLVTGSLAILWWLSDGPPSTTASASASAPKGDKRPAAPRPETDPSALQGTWEGECVPVRGGRFAQPSVTFTDATYFGEVTIHASASCTDPVYIVTVLEDVVNIRKRADGVFDVDLRVGDLKIVPVAPNIMNREGFLGSRQWGEGIARDLSPAAATDYFGVALRPSMATFDLVSVRGNVLYRGRGAPTNARLPHYSERPTAIDESVRYFRQ